MLAGAKVGDRIGAYMSHGDKKIKWLGYGTYDGKRPPREAAGLTAYFMVGNFESDHALRLDGGGVVYGCECWWDSEERIKAELEQYRKRGYEITEVSIGEARAEYRARN